MQAKSINGENVKAIEVSLKESLADGFKPTLAIVFLSVKTDFRGITDLLDGHGIQVFGATTNGEFIDDELGSETAAMLLLDISKEHFKIYSESFPNLQFREASKKIAKQSLADFERPAFIISGSNLSTDAEELLRGFEDICGEDVIVYGGMAGDDFTFTDQFVFTNSQYLNQGLITLALDRNAIDIHGHALCGWKSVGTEKLVTKSEGNHVFTIEGVPAMDIMAKYGGITDASPNNENLLMEMATLCPLQLQRTDAPPVMRPGLVIDWTDKSIFTSGTIAQGSKVKFCLPPDFDAIEAVIDGCRELKNNEAPEADAIIYFTCAGRLVTFGPVMEKEIEGIKGVWNTPLVGMFSNAELGRAKGGALEQHNLSTCCVVLKEK